MLILQTEGDDSRCELDLPQHFGNLSSLKTVSLVLDTDRVNFYITFHPNKNNSLAVTIGFLNSLVLRRILFFKWPRHYKFYYTSPVYRSRCKCNDYYVNDTKIMLPITKKDVNLLCDRCSPFNCDDCSCCVRGGHLFLIEISVASVILLIAIVTAVICFCRKRMQRRLRPEESPGYLHDLERNGQGLMIVYASGDQVFDHKSPEHTKIPLFTAADVSYHRMGKAGSWEEILDNFNTKPRTTCVTIITSNYLHEMRKFLEKACDDDMFDPVTSFHLSQRTFPVLIGDINVEDFPTSLRAVYFKLNLQRWPNYPGCCSKIQNMLRRIHTR